MPVVLDALPCSPKEKKEPSRVPEWYTFELFTEDFGDSFDLATLKILCFRNCDNFAFIVHEPESDDKKEHVHVLCQSLNYRNTDAWLKRMPSPVAFRHWLPVRKPCAFARYMLHWDEKSVAAGKKRYERSDIVTNSDEWFDSLLYGDDSDAEDAEREERINESLRILEDARLLSCRKISLQSFIKSHPEAIYRMNAVKTLIDFEQECVSRDTFVALKNEYKDLVQELTYLRAGISLSCGLSTYDAFLRDGKKHCDKIHSDSTKSEEN